MERDPNDGFGTNQGDASSRQDGYNFSPGGNGGIGNSDPGPGAGAGGLDAAGAGALGSSGYTGSQSFGSESGTAGEQGQRTRDQAKEKLDQAKEQFGKGKDKAVEMKSSLESTLAQKLETGAQKLRSRSASTGGAAYAGVDGATAGASEQVDRYGASLATGMERTADWLRDGDLKATVEQQVRQSPGRTLLIALGVGYLIGKAVKR